MSEERTESNLSDAVQACVARDVTAQQLLSGLPRRGSRGQSSSDYEHKREQHLKNLEDTKVGDPVVALNFFKGKDPNSSRRASIAWL